MADVLIRCAKCGQEVSVSEFVEQSTLVCFKCGEKLTIAKPLRLADTRTLLRKDAPRPETAEEAAKREQMPRKLRKRRSVFSLLGRIEVGEYLISWIFFLLAAPALGYLRYSHYLTPETVQVMGLWGAGFFFVMYLVCVLDVLREDLFSGMLSLFVPPYTFYCLFFKLDSFFLRSIMSVLIIAFGWDVSLILWDWAVAAYVKITWLIGGGLLE